MYHQDIEELIKAIVSSVSEVDKRPVLTQNFTSSLRTRRERLAGA